MGDLAFLAVFALSLWAFWQAAPQLAAWLRRRKR